MRTISRNNIKHTSFTQVLAAEAVAVLRKQMGPKEKALFNLLQNYLNLSDDADNAEVTVKFLEEVYATNRITFEVVACGMELDIDAEQELRVMNCLLPADNLILLPVSQYDKFTRTNDISRPHPLKVRGMQ